MAPTPALLPGKSHGWRRLVGYRPWGPTESDTTEWLHFHLLLSCFGEGNGNPLQCSCLENPRDGEAWWAVISGVAQSRTRLKWLSTSSSIHKWIFIVKIPRTRIHAVVIGTLTFGEGPIIRKFEVGFWRVAIPSFFILILVKTINLFWLISSSFPLMFYLYCMYFYKGISSVQSLSRVRLCDPMDCSMPGFPVHHQFPELTQTHLHWLGDTIQPSHPLSSPSPPTLNLFRHQGLFQWVSSSHLMAKVLEFQL